MSTSVGSRSERQTWRSTKPSKESTRPARARKAATRSSERSGATRRRDMETYTERQCARARQEAHVPARTPPKAMADVPAPPPPRFRAVRQDLPSVRAIVRTVIIVIVSAITLYLIYLLRKPIGWIVVAGFLAVALSAPVNLLARHMRRGLAIVIVYICVLLTPVLLGLLIVPPIVREGNQLAQDLPGYVVDVRDFISRNSTLQKLERDYQITTKLEEQANKLPSKLGGAASTLGSIGLGLVNSLFAALNIFILSVFMVSGGPRWIRWGVGLQPAGRRERMSRILDASRRAVASYIGGA